MMRTQAFDETEALTPRQARAYEQWTKFDVYGVFHFNRDVEGASGTEKIYKAVAERFIVAASKRIFGKSGFRRRHPRFRLIRSEMTIEKKKDNPHLNVLFRLPDGYDFAQFRERVLDEWLKSPWAAKDGKAAYLETRQSMTTRLVAYNHKERDRVSIDRMLTV